MRKFGSTAAAPLPSSLGDRWPDSSHTRTAAARLSISYGRLLMDFEHQIRRTKGHKSHPVVAGVR